MSNSKRRKTEAETLPIVSESRRAQRRPVGGLHDHPLRVEAIKLPRRQFLHSAAGREGSRRAREQPISKGVSLTGRNLCISNQTANHS
jgi:hypothetical protein